MGWTMILKSILLTTVKQKAAEAGKEGIYSKAVYLPLLYLVTATPTLLLLTGFALLVTAGVAQFFPVYIFPTDFILVLGLLSTIMSVVMFLAFRLFLRKIIPKEATEITTNSPLNIEEKIEGAFAPFLLQLKEEQSLFKNSNFRSPK